MGVTATSTQVEGVYKRWNIPMQQKASVQVGVKAIGRLIGRSTSQNGQITASGWVNTREEGDRSVAGLGS